MTIISEYAEMKSGRAAKSLWLDRDL